MLKKKSFWKRNYDIILAYAIPIIITSFLMISAKNCVDSGPIPCGFGSAMLFMIVVIPLTIILFIFALIRQIKNEYLRKSLARWVLIGIPVLILLGIGIWALFTQTKFGYDLLN